MTVLTFSSSLTCPCCVFMSYNLINKAEDFSAFVLQTTRIHKGGAYFSRISSFAQHKQGLNNKKNKFKNISYWYRPRKSSSLQVLSAGTFSGTSVRLLPHGKQPPHDSRDTDTGKVLPNLRLYGNHSISQPL